MRGELELIMQLKNFITQLYKKMVGKKTRFVNSYLELCTDLKKEQANAITKQHLHQQNEQSEKGLIS